MAEMRAVSVGIATESEPDVFIPVHPVCASFGDGGCNQLTTYGQFKVTRIWRRKIAKLFADQANG
jgi:hypothetical protein